MAVSIFFPVLWKEYRRDERVSKGIRWKMSTIEAVVGARVQTQDAS
jgi:hypothetical protein